MDDLVPKYPRERPAFIDQNTGGRASARVEKIRHDTGIVLVPFIEDLGFLRSAFLFGFGPGLGPARAGHFISVPVVAALEDIIDSDATVPVVVVIGLPESAEGIDGNFIIIAEI